MFFYKQYLRHESAPYTDLLDSHI